MAIRKRRKKRTRKRKIKNQAPKMEGCLIWFMRLIESLTHRLVNYGYYITFMFIFNSIFEFNIFLSFQ